MAKFILLDFDGVVTSKTYTMKCYREHARENIYGMDWFDPECVEALKKIVDETGAKIVVSSSWRDLRIEQLQRIWAFIPMPGELVETTPVWILTKKGAIEHWIKQHPDDRHVILDDADLGIDNQIRTDPHTGLVRDDAERAIKILNESWKSTK